MISIAPSRSSSPSVRRCLHLAGALLAVALLAGGAFTPAAASTPVAGALVVGAASRSPAASVPSPPHATSAPTMVAHTTDGAIGYREIGTGSPLLLLMGYLGSMDNWAPDFVDQLARSHRVVMMDNAGVGGTAQVRGTLTIDAMAAQASALLDALHLGKVAVLGWSMGGMTAQALAVLHPGQVTRLVLAATQVGNGKALAVPAAAAAKLASPDPAVVLSALFPPGQGAAARAYAFGLLQYPGFYTAPASVLVAQSSAVGQWIEGKDPAGREVTRIGAPALVADGTADALDPAQNAYLLADAIKGSKVHLYPDAGHAFLFQDYAEFISAVNAFLG